MTSSRLDTAEIRIQPVTHCTRLPHWYLPTVGATLSHRGIGTALLPNGLTRADGLVYLESSNSRSIPLYERHGFTATGEVTLPDCPILYTMVRNRA